MFMPLLETILVALIGPSTHDHAHAHPNPVAPLTITLHGPAAVAPQQDLELMLEIHRVAPDGVPMTLAIALPDGVVLRDGATSVVLVDDTREVIALPIHLRTTRVPERDLVVTVDVDAKRYGVHARADYRFGRAEPTSLHVPLGPELRGSDGRSVGHPVDLSRVARAK